MAPFLRIAFSSYELGVLPPLPDPPFCAIKLKEALVTGEQLLLWAAANHLPPYQHPSAHTFPLLCTRPNRLSPGLPGFSSKTADVQDRRCSPPRSSVAGIALYIGRSSNCSVTALFDSASRPRCRATAHHFPIFKMSFHTPRQPTSSYGPLHTRCK